MRDPNLERRLGLVRTKRSALRSFSPANSTVIALEVRAFHRRSENGDFDLSSMLVPLALARGSRRRPGRLRTATLSVAILSVLAVGPCGCSQSDATATGSVASGGGDGSGGLSLNVPPPTMIDCDAAAPVENLTPPQPSDSLCDPSAATASFSKDVVPIVSSCNGEVCHSAWAYEALVGAHSTICCDKRFLVNPYLPSESALVQALLGTNSCVGQMPPGRPFAKAQLEPVIAWVCQGAAKN